jgi:hypothetical protein
MLIANNKEKRKYVSQHKIPPVLTNLLQFTSLSFLLLFTSLALGLVGFDGSTSNWS